MIELKKAVRIKGKIVIPYYIQDGDVICFDKNGKQICLKEEDFIKKEKVVNEDVQVVIPIEPKKKPAEEPKQNVEVKQVEQPKKQEEVKKQDSYISNENYI